MARPRDFSADERLEKMAHPRNAGDNARRVREEFWPKVKAMAARVPFIEDLVAAYYAAQDPQTPRSAKLLIVAALAYFIMPIDAVPDFLLGFGFTDDAAVFWAAWRSIRGHITEEHRWRAADAVDRLRDDSE